MGWLAPQHVNDNALYYSLDDAYALEASSEGVWATAGNQAATNALMNEDRRLTGVAEEERFAESGVRLGEAPNY